MPPHRRQIVSPVVLALIALACVVPPAHALRVVTWNITQYPGLALSTRQPHFRTVMAAMNADVVIVQELNSAAGRDSFLTNVLNVVEPGQWAATSWFNLAANSEGGAVFYKTAKVSLIGASQFSTGGLRDVLVCLIKPIGYTSNAAATRLYSVHFKAGGPGGADSTLRRNECASLRSTLNALPAGTSFMMGGDTNIYGAYEGAYMRLTEIQADNDGRCKDPLAMPGTWHENSGYALYHSQCPCNTGCIGGFAGGGMDDRFDLWLTSYSMQDGEGIDYVTDFTVANGAYPYTYGNDGTKYNTDINSGGANGMVPIAVANALHDASDHLPVIITIQVPAKVAAPPTLAFGNVLIGATANLNLPVSNGATAPADELSYTLSAPADFTAPGGAFAADAGAAANNHAVGMSTGSVGAKGGTLTVNSDDVDLPVANVALSGTVLDHAASSLDSSAALLTTPVDFGDHAVGEFSNQPVRVHNLGWDALQAQLAVSSANIVGGDGRFSVVGGFSPTLLSGVGQSWNLAFDDVGATLDQEYTATLTFACADEALPGAAAANDLVVTLRAKPLSTPTGVPGQDLPKALAFHAPRPNPLSREALFAFDLPESAPVSLAIYDLTGRRIASIVSGSLGAGRYQLPWSAVTEGGARVPGGLYFARFITPGMTRVSRLIVLP